MSLIKKLSEVGEKMELRQRMDSWINTVTGLGTTRDKRTYWDFQRQGSFGAEYYEGMFLEDDLAYTAVARLPDRAMRKGIFLHREADEGEDPAKIESMKADVHRRLRELHAIEKVFEAAVWGRLTGAGILLLGVRGGGNVVTPLDLERGDLALDFLTVLDIRDMHPQVWYDDPTAPKYGEVELYGFTPSVAGSGGTSSAQKLALIHESRLVVFDGAMVTPRERERNKGFSHSVLYRTWPKIKAHGAMWSSVEHLLEDMSQAVLSIKGLIDALDEQDTATMETRIQLMDMARSVARVLLIDEEESFDRKTTPLSGVEQIISAARIRVAAALDMPVTELFGTSAVGLSATGEGDRISWNDSVEAYQTKTLQAPIEKVVRLVVQSLFPEEDPSLWSIKWPNLYSQTPREEAEQRKLIAETDAIHIQNGVAIAEEITLSRFSGPTGYSVETTVNVDLRRKLIEAEAARIEAMASADDPTLETGGTGGATGQGSKVADVSLNGAQIKSMVEIVTAVAVGDLPRETGVEMIAASFPLSRETADRIMGDVGGSFTTEKPEPPPMAPGQPPMPEPEEQLDPENPAEEQEPEDA